MWVRVAVFACPRCRSARLRVEVTFRGMIDCEFREDGDFVITSDVAFDSAWGPDSACECQNCEWKGVIAEARDGNTLDASDSAP